MDSKKQPEMPGTTSPDSGPDAQQDIVAIELRKAREAKGLSHSELHRQTGISRAVLFGYEAGRTKPGAKEIRLLSTALGVSPTRLLFGTDDPFKPVAGIRTLAKLRNTPLSLVISMMLLPAAFAVLDEEQVESLLTILSSMVEARDKEAHKRISAVIETIAAEIGSGAADDMSAFLQRAKDPNFQSELAKKIEARLSNN